jgi:MFS family permease
LANRVFVWTAALIWVFIKLPQEWWIHVAQLDFTEFMDDNPWAYFVIGAAALALAIGLWVNRRKIPKTDWPFTVTVDKHLPPIEVDVPRTTVFDAVLVEKVVFMSLVAVIFAQIVPDVRSSNLGIAIGVTVLVVLNTLVTEWIYKRGHSWRNSVTAFVATLVINVGLVFADSLLSPRRDAPNRSTLFVVLVLSLLIALYDRYRATRGATDIRTPAIAAWRAERRKREAVA